MKEGLSSFETMGDRLMPQNIESEEAILGGILLDPEAIDRVVELLRPEFFFIMAHQTIYRMICHLHAQRKPTDLMTVTTGLADHNLLEQVGGQFKLAQLVDRTVSAVNIDQYALLVVDKYLRRQLIFIGHEIVKLGYETAIELPLILDEAGQKVFEITRAAPHLQVAVEPVSEVLIRNFSEIEAYAAGIAQPGISTGLMDLDKITGGLQRQDLIVVAGRPSTGKTSFGLNLAHNIAFLKQMPVVIFSLEMSKEQLTYRLLSRTARIEGNRLKSGRVALGEWEALSKAVGEVAELPIFIDDTSNPSVLDIKAAMRQVVSKYAVGQQLGMVLVDYLQLMGQFGESNRVQEIDQITRTFKQLAKDFNVPVVCLSQLNRGVESRQEKRPTLSDLRDSGAIEQAADLVMLLYREDYYKSDTSDKGIVEVNIAKHRNGPVGIVKLFFEREYSRFIDLHYAA